MDRGCFLSWIYHRKKSLYFNCFQQVSVMWKKCWKCVASVCCPCVSPSLLPPAPPRHSPSDSLYHLQTQGRFRACPLVILSRFFLVLILFQAIQERLQAWVNQWPCSMLVNTCNSIEKSILGKKTMQIKLLQIFFASSSHQENHTVKALPVTTDKCHKYFTLK